MRINTLCVAASFKLAAFFLLPHPAPRISRRSSQKDFTLVEWPSLWTKRGRPKRKRPKRSRPSLGRFICNNLTDTVNGWLAPVAESAGRKLGGKGFFTNDGPVG
ncbi:MAG: hypothetical protein ACYS32_11440 [Planctomycetota bacterium]|jgi:hypothetical protein